MNNIAKSFVTWLHDNGYGTFNNDIFISGVPLEAKNNCFWILAGGGAPISKHVTGEKQKKYVIHVFYRNNDAEVVYNTLQALEELLNNKSCINLSGYIVTESEAFTFPTDQDLDANDRTIGLLQAAITVYQND